MRILKAAILLCLLTLFAIAGTKQATQNTNTQAATSANANTSPTKSAFTPISTTPDGAKVFTYPEGGIQCEIPSTWETEVDGELLNISTPDDVLNITLWVLEEGSIEEAAEAIDEELGNVMTDIEMGEEKEGNLNGMKVYSVSGTGKIDGTTVQWSLALIEAKKPVFALAFAEPDLWEKYQKEFGAFVKSIKRMN